jgi:hypothetical protein
MLVLGVYAALYWRALAKADRYKKGFVIPRCPICRQGDLVVETRRERLFGIPRPRHTVYCTHCRSLLRESGDRVWRYAVDPLDNPALFQRLNGQLLTEDDLRVVAQQSAESHVEPPAPRDPPVPPQFVDEEEQP